MSDKKVEIVEVSEEVEVEKKEDGFMERLIFFVNMTDPRTLIYSDEAVRLAQNICKIYDEIEKPKDTREYQHAKKICDAAIHPVTNEIIPKPFRVSAIAPVNIPIVFLMLACPASNVPGTLFLHWFNQSYNTACNYANRAGAEQSMEATIKAYGLAVSSACAFAYGLGKLSAKSAFLKRFGVIIPCLATAAANVSNVAFTRAAEIVDGAPVVDADGNPHGLSKIAGTQGVFQTAMTRCLLVPCSCILLPPLVMAGLKKINALPAAPKAVTAVELGIIYLSLQAALPAALAVFPQKAKFDVNKLEPQFKYLWDKKTNKKIDFLYSNKGL